MLDTPLHRVWRAKVMELAEAQGEWRPHEHLVIPDEDEAA